MSFLQWVINWTVFYFYFCCFRTRNKSHNTELVTCDRFLSFQPDRRLIEEMLHQAMSTITGAKVPHSSSSPWNPVRLYKASTQYSSVSETRTFTFWNSWYHQGTTTLMTSQSCVWWNSFSPYIHLQRFNSIACPVREISRWRHQATTTFSDVIILGILTYLVAWCFSVKFQLNWTFRSWDIDIHILKLLTSSGHACFRWRNWTLPSNRPWHSVSTCKVSTQSDFYFLRYWHSHFEIDDVIMPRPLSLTSLIWAHW